jgi:hypothetical protein
MIRALTLALGLALAGFSLSAAPVSATPGAVNAQGCHGAHGRMGYHCHGMNATMKFHTKNQRFVPFGRG